MKKHIALVFGSVVIAMLALSSPVLAQQKTVKACEDEWKANKDANQAAKITEKAYVEKCRAGTAAAAPTAASAPAAAVKPATANTEAPTQKTVKACEDEWKANKDANQAAKITEKAYVEKCRAGTATAATAPAPAATAPAAPSKTAAPAASTPAAAVPKSATAPAPAASAGQFSAEAQAKGRCPTDTVVWVNLDSKIYHFNGTKDYGHTKEGAYMCEKDTAAAGFRAAKNEKHP